MKNKESTPLLIIIDDIEKWNPFYPTDQVISAKDYLFSDEYRDLNRANIINLCMDSGYLSLGHYCSMIAEARGHKTLPSIKTMNDLQEPSLYLSDLDYLKPKILKVIKDLPEDFKGDIEKGKLSILSVFGRAENKALNSLTKDIFNTFPVPILEIEISKPMGFWAVASLKIRSLNFIPANSEDFFAQSIDKFSNRLWRTPKNRKKYIYDLGILITKGEELPPSDEKALQKFEKACDKLDVFSERIEEHDIGRISEFDAILVRTTTSINNFTYKFVKTAEMEGVVVIDDSDSILKCTNKIYVNNCLEKKKIRTIPGSYVGQSDKHKYEKLIEKYGLPLICKVPDGSFSIGVKKAKSLEELESILDEMFKHSSLVLVQKFLQTPYDWRIGILDNEPIFACKYYMSQGHWQIYNHTKKLDDKNFSGKSETLPIYDVPKPVIQAALGAASTIGNGLYGIDIKEDINGDVYIVEINDNPNIDSGIEDKVEKGDLYEKIVQSMIDRINKEKKLHE